MNFTNSCWAYDCYTVAEFSELTDQPDGDCGVESSNVVNKQHSHIAPTHSHTEAGVCNKKIWKVKVKI